MKKLHLIKKVEGIRFVQSTYVTSIIDGYKEILIVSDKKTGWQDLYEVFYVGSEQKRSFLSRVCEMKTNREIVEILQQKLGMVV